MKSQQEQQSAMMIQMMQAQAAQAQASQQQMMTMMMMMMMNGPRHPNTNTPFDPTTMSTPTQHLIVMPNHVVISPNLVISIEIDVLLIFWIEHCCDSIQAHMSCSEVM